MEIDLLSAWGLWMQGQALDGYSLWGLSIRWWGRIGQVVQMLSALTILAEIIGATRLRDFGCALHTGITLRKLTNIGQDALQYRREVRDYMLRRTNRKEYERFSEWFPGVDLITSFAIVAIVLQYLGANWWVTILLTPLIGGVFSVTLGDTLMVVIIYTGLLLGLIIDIVVIEPIAWIIDLSAIDRVIKIGSVLGLLIGFHFSLLAS